METLSTESFSDTLVIDTPEKARQLALAFALAEKRGRVKPDQAILKKLAEDEEYFKDPKNWPNVK
ncbi:MAG: hypothetical protein LBT41_04245 [Candidatus Methanoplasma sp.]|nr:hypothetical protein [Candidatus Methanoplasma sp.]